MREESPPRPSRILRRGLARRCPHCGVGPLFEKRLRLHDRCAACGVRFLRNQGDPWAFMLLIDRAVYVFPIVAALFLGLHRHSLPAFLLFAAGLVALLLATAPSRFGLCIALDYLTRRRWPDERDVLPPLPPGTAP